MLQEMTLHAHKYKYNTTSQKTHTPHAQNDIHGAILHPFMSNTLQEHTYRKMMHIHRSNITMHTHSSTHAHTFIYTCTHIHLHMHTHSSTHAHTFIYTCTHIHLHMHTHSSTHAHTFIYTCTHIHLHMHTHSSPHAHTFIYTCTHIHLHMHTHSSTHAHTFIHAHTQRHLHNYVMHTLMDTHTHTHPHTQHTHMPQTQKAPQGHTWQQAIHVVWRGQMGTLSNHTSRGQKEPL